MCQAYPKREAALDRFHKGGGVRPQPFLDPLVNGCVRCSLTRKSSIKLLGYGALRKLALLVAVAVASDDLCLFFIRNWKVAHWKDLEMFNDFENRTRLAINRIAKCLRCCAHTGSTSLQMIYHALVHKGSSEVAVHQHGIPGLRFDPSAILELENLQYTIATGFPNNETHFETNIIWKGFLHIFWHYPCWSWVFQILMNASMMWAEN